MIQLYTWGTTNGRRPIVFLEESGTPYTIHPVNIREGQQKTDEYAKISPFRKIPSMIDDDANGGGKVSLFESVAIVMYLAEKTGKFCGSTTAEKADVLKWTIFITCNMLPVLGLIRQEHQGLDDLGQKQLDVIETALDGRDYIAGAYSIADMILVTRMSQYEGHPWMDARPRTKAWYARVSQRPAVQKAMTMKIG
ncbi:MAG: hypothetical protein RLZ98_1500 [Pseudomonadota bacterium]|jgi:GST-like protein